MKLRGVVLGNIILVTWLFSKGCRGKNKVYIFVKIVCTRVKVKKWTVGDFIDVAPWEVNEKMGKREV